MGAPYGFANAIVQKTRLSVTCSHHESQHKRRKVAVTSSIKCWCIRLGRDPTDRTEFRGIFFGTNTAIEERLRRDKCILALLNARIEQHMNQGKEQ